MLGGGGARECVGLGVGVCAGGGGGGGKGMCRTRSVCWGVGARECVD